MSFVHRNIFSTHEEAQVTSLGEWPGDGYLGVALPSTKALRKKVLVEYQGKSVIAEVCDVGPWATDNVGYVFGEERPRAEIHKGRYCPLKEGSLALATVPDGNGGMRGVAICNGAGIDLFPGTAKALGIELNQNVLVDWSFV
jgi:hypothetical protein